MSSAANQSRLCPLAAGECVLYALTDRRMNCFITSAPGCQSSKVSLALLQKQLDCRYMVPCAPILSVIPILLLWAHTVILWWITNPCIASIVCVSVILSLIKIHTLKFFTSLVGVQPSPLSTYSQCHTLNPAQIPADPVLSPESHQEESWSQLLSDGFSCCLL